MLELVHTTFKAFFHTPVFYSVTTKLQFLLAARGTPGEATDCSVTRAGKNGVAQGTIY